MTAQTQLEHVLDQLIQLLDSVGESNWQFAFKNFRRKCKITNTREENSLLASQISGVYGGMGSFSDLVLYKCGKLVVSENEELAKLRTQLWAIAQLLR